MRLHAAALLLLLAACHRGTPETRPRPTRQSSRTPAQPQHVTVTAVEPNAQAPSYFRAVARAVGEHYSARTGSRGAVVLFVVERDGRIHDIDLSVPSGDPDFDQGALEAVHGTRAPRVPDIILGSSVALRAVFTPVR